MSRIRNAAVIVLVVLMAPAMAAQERRQGGPPPYDPSKEVTVMGVVKGMESVDVPDGKRAILVLTVDNENLGVLLGPATWFEKQGMKFAPGAAVQVTGLTGYRYNGGSAIMPRLVKAGAKTLKLRDEAGKPLWEKELGGGFREKHLRARLVTQPALRPA
jgi:hypothetical protein